MFIVAMIVATVGAIVTIVLYGSVLNGMGAETLRGFLKVRTQIFAAMAEGYVLFKGHQKFSKKEHIDRFSPQNTEHLTTFLHKITSLNLCLA